MYYIAMWPNNTCLMAPFQRHLNKPALERETLRDFNEATGDGVAVVSAEVYANYFHLTLCR